MRRAKVEADVESMRPRAAADPALPTDAATGAALPPREQPGYYPGFSTLAQRNYWDAATRAAVEERVARYSGPERGEPPRFFNPAEARLLLAVIERVLPQSDRVPARRIRIFPVIDERLASGRIDGQRYADTPPDGESYRLGLRAIELMARDRCHCEFGALGGREQDTLLGEIHDGHPRGSKEVETIWKRLPAHRFWKMLMQDCAAAYYSHPWAWDEIGYGGPAYPRAYTRIERGDPEPWERDERRYGWRAPDDSRSDEPSGGR